MYRRIRIYVNGEYITTIGTYKNKRDTIRRIKAEHKIFSESSGWTLVYDSDTITAQYEE